MIFRSLVLARGHPELLVMPTGQNDSPEAYESDILGGDALQRTPLHMAVAHLDDVGLELVQELARLNPDAVCMPDGFGSTPLHGALCALEELGFGAHAPDTRLVESLARLSPLALAVPNRFLDDAPQFARELELDPETLARLLRVFAEAAATLA